ncbi:AraC family transcriptional regulator [Paenibacillus silvisoli]|uniref:AraC family transcriptional regulator n=1 Tax=Paenibacillus silvisoli TaxID=3110539 RepID=UPI00280631F0|nr:AraC family transcriptional regulator [Paenibacillus silvisoli]
MTKHPKYFQNFENSGSSFPFHIRTSHLTETVAAHRHDFLEFSYVKEGFGTELINGKPYKLQPGTLTFLLPFQYHQIVPSPDSPLLVYHTGMEMSLFSGASAKGEGFEELLLSGDNGLPPCVRFTDRKKETVDRIVDELLIEQQADQPWKFVLMRAKLHELLVLFDRKRRDDLQEIKHDGAAITPKDDIWAVAEYLHAHFRENISFSDLAHHFHYNESHLSVTFKKQIGENVSDFLQNLRIRLACSLLATSDMKIIDIAEEVGFRSFSTFARTFKQKKGVPPTAFRKVIGQAYDRNDLD